MKKRQKRPATRRDPRTATGGAKRPVLTRLDPNLYDRLFALASLNSRSLGAEAEVAIEAYVAAAASSAASRG